MKVVVINGHGGVGKDLFVLYCQAWNGTRNVKNYSTVDYVKAVAANLGWDGTKTDANRKFLSDLKKILTEWDDIPYRKTRLVIEEFENKLKKRGQEYWKNGVIFIHCREPEEIQRFKEEFDAHTLLIRREQAENTEWTNASDKSVLGYQYDTVIHNDGTLEQLRDAAKDFLVNDLGVTFKV